MKNILLYSYEPLHMVGADVRTIVVVITTYRALIKCQALVVRCVTRHHVGKDSDKR